MEETQKSDMQKKETVGKAKQTAESGFGLIGTILWGIFIFILLLLGFSVNWGMKTWVNLTMEEMVYTLTASLKGTGGGMIGKYLLSALLPAAVLAIAAVVVVRIVYRKTWKTYFLRIGVFCGALLFCGLMVWKFWCKLDVSTYIENQTSDAAFIEAQYVNPLDAEIAFPNEKRNLIYIFLESMETTYADRANGGGFSFNCIPELTELAQENEDFSGSSKALNGGHVTPGTTWTMGAMFAQTSGIPLQVSIDGNSMGTQEHFFPGMINLGDILEMGGYRQALLIGSEAEFGGRELFFREHGNYEMKDYLYAADNGLIPVGYKVSWGYEDKKLFEIAKEEISQMAAGSQPFNFTILTVDTHFEDGYLCEDCRNDFAGNQYANVMACSSRKVAEFIAWIQTQDFYENTTIVLSGDHLTMDSDFCDEMSESYTRKTYTCFINPGCENKQAENWREYTTMDIFPTTLAALGMTIKGERLGLGTNLFSEKQTLAEEYGWSYVYNEMAKKSELLTSMAQVDETTDAYLKSQGTYPEAVVQVQEEENGILYLTVSGIVNLDNPARVELDLWEIGKDDTVQTVLLEQEQAGYGTKLPVEEYREKRIGSAIYLVDEEQRRYKIGELSGDLELYTNDFCRYLSVLCEKDYTVFLAVRDEAATGLNARGSQKLKELGLQKDLSGQIRSSYYAVLDAGEVLCEELSTERIAQEGILSDGLTSYSIVSSGFLAGSDCSIRINGTEYAMGKRGINIVVYDTKTERVVDSVCFDTYSGESVTRSSGTIEFSFLEGKMDYLPDEELQGAEFCEYLQKVKEKESYVLLLAIKDEGTYGLTEEMKQALYGLGLKTDLTEQYRCSYYAVADGTQTEEQCGSGVLNLSGTLSDGTFYEVRSEGYNADGSKCSIQLNGVEFAINTRGMNVVIYDKEQGCVVDTVVFDTYENAAAKRSE